MDLRFLAVVESSAPDFPFVPGQILPGLVRLSSQMQAWIREGRAEIVRDEDELATMAAPERAVARKRR